MSKVHLSIKTIFGRPKGGRIRQVSLYNESTEVQTLGVIRIQL